MNTCFVVTVLEPIKYPSFLPNSFSYLRQQLDLLAQFRVNSIIHYHEEDSHMKYGEVTVQKPRRPRILEYLFDGYLPAKEFVNAVKKHFPRIKCHFKEWKRGK